MSRKEEIKKITEQIVSGYNPERIILFGSSAIGEDKSNSDIDIAIIKKTRESFSERLKEIARIIKTWEAMDALVYTPEEWERGLENNYFIKEIQKTGRLLYEK